LRTLVEAVVASVEGSSAAPQIPLDVQGSAFQWKGWRELQKRRVVDTRACAEIADAIGSPRAVRAVASAIANNRVAVIIPCQRVIRQSGELGGYRWGIERKQQLIARENTGRAKSTS